MGRETGSAFADAVRAQFEVVLAVESARQSGVMPARPDNLAMTGDRLTSPIGPNLGGGLEIT